MTHEQALMDARARGYREALYDAHDAIGALPTSLTKFGTMTIMESVNKAAALAAIDALRERE